MRHRLVGRELAQAAQRERPPCAVALLPVQRRLPAAALHRGPAVGEPRIWIAVAARGDEREIVAIRDGPARERERLEVDAVARTLVVEREARACVADLVHAARERHEARVARIRAGGMRGRLAVGRRERVLREQVLHIGEDQLLMLLFVVGAEQHHLAQRRIELPAFEQREQVPIDVLAIGVHLLERRPAEQAALRARVLRTDGVVVGIEQVSEQGIERAVARQRRLERERLEVPARVREVPFGRARVGHRLQRAVLGGKRLGKC